MKAVFKTGLLVLAVAAAPALADGKAEAKYRHDVMEAIGGHMSSIGVILREGIHRDDLATHANAINALAAIAPNIFPEGSDTSDSEALDDIWEEPEEFAEAMQRFVDAAAGMATAASSGDMREIGPAVKALGGSCKGCHDDFKEE